MSTFWQLSITGLLSTVFCTIEGSLDEVAPDIYLHLAIHSKIALNYWFSLGDCKVKHCAFGSAPSAEPLRMQVINRREKEEKKKKETTHRFLPALFMPVGKRSRSTPRAEPHSSSRWSPAQNQSNKCCYSIVKHVILSPLFKKAQGCTMQTPAHHYQGRTGGDQLKLGMGQLK